MDKINISKPTKDLCTGLGYRETIWPLNSAFHRIMKTDEWIYGRLQPTGEKGQYSVCTVLKRQVEVIFSFLI